MAITAAELAEINVMFVQNFEPQVTQRHWLFRHSVNLMSVTAASHNCRQIAAGVIRRVSKVAADDDGGMIEQRSVTFGDAVDIDQELVDMLDDVSLDPTEWFQQILLASVMR